MSHNEFGELPRTAEQERIRNAAFHAHRPANSKPDVTDILGEQFVADRKAYLASRKRDAATPVNVRPAYQNTITAIEIAVKALEMAASNAEVERAHPSVIVKLRSDAARLSAYRIEVMKGNPA